MGWEWYVDRMEAEKLDGNCEDKRGWGAVGVRESAGLCCGTFGYHVELMVLWRGVVRNVTG